MASHPLRTPVRALPRFSVAALVLALTLSVVLSTIVGIVAWSVGDTGISSSELTAAREGAYKTGFADGRAAGFAAGKERGLRAARHVVVQLDHR